MAKNLLKNPHGDDLFGSWDLLENGGDEWKVEKLGVDGPNDIQSGFCTSYELCLKRQVINLEAEGFTADDLDARPPITVRDWYSDRTNLGSTYQLTVRLQDHNQKVLKEFKHSVTLSGDSSWRQVNHTFSDYGAGVRFISFQHGGRDNKSWAGWYGVRVTGSSVIVG